MRYGKVSKGEREKQLSLTLKAGNSTNRILFLHGGSSLCLMAGEPENLESRRGGLEKEKSCGKLRATCLPRASLFSARLGPAIVGPPRDHDANLYAKTLALAQCAQNFREISN